MRSLGRNSTLPNIGLSRSALTQRGVIRINALFDAHHRSSHKEGPRGNPFVFEAVMTSNSDQNTLFAWTPNVDESNRKDSLGLGYLLLAPIADSHRALAHGMLNTLITSSRRPQHHRYPIAVNPSFLYDFRSIQRPRYGVFQDYTKVAWLRS